MGGLNDEHVSGGWVCDGLEAFRQFKVQLVSLTACSTADSCVRQWIWNNNCIVIMKIEGADLTYFGSFHETTWSFYVGLKFNPVKRNTQTEWNAFCLVSACFSSIIKDFHLVITTENKFVTSRTGLLSTDSVWVSDVLGQPLGWGNRRKSWIGCEKRSSEEGDSEPQVRAGGEAGLGRGVLKAQLK